MPTRGHLEQNCENHNVQKVNSTVTTTRRPGRLDYTYDASTSTSMSTRNQRVNRGDASTRKGNRSLFLCLRLCLRPCVARGNRDYASISTTKHKFVNGLLPRRPPVLNLKLWRQNVNFILHLMLVLITRVNNLVLMFASYV